MPQYEDFIALSRYARFREDLGRRETWPETCQRVGDFWKKRFPDHSSTIDGLTTAMTEKRVMGSMRVAMTAGPALEESEVAGFNCSFTAIDHPRCFDEIVYILMCGTGVGFSVERQVIAQLPEIAEAFYETDTTIVVKDSKIGWASAYRELISLLYAGKVPKWDVSKVRPAGARLKTFGGRSSGPEPLVSLFQFTIATFKKAAGRKLNSLEVHDIVCKIADIVVVGGVRRSALISLSNLSDDRLRGAKSGQWWLENPQRALANNSVAYTEKPDMGIFMKEWESLYESKSGERGIFNRQAVKKIVKRSGRREVEWDFGTNPCGEIVLRSGQFCNLSEVIARPEDTFDSLKEKVRLATIIGVFQSTLTNFKYLRKHWKRNTEEERLLGVSITGIMDHDILNGSTHWEDCEIFKSYRGDDETSFGWASMVSPRPEGGVLGLPNVLLALKQVAIDTAKEWSEKLGVPMPTAITCVKPSGTVSQLVDSSSGIHPRFAPYYIRTVRADRKDPLCQFMMDRGFPHEPCVNKGDSTIVFSFPMKAPPGATFKVDAISQLELWSIYSDCWCEHNPSITVYVKEHEWMKVGAWVYENFDKVAGVSFLPYSDHIYEQAPYQAITEEEYNTFLALMPEVDWSELAEYEKEDYTTGSQELACVAGSCEI